MAEMCLTVSDVESKPNNEWILDSACSFHMCPKRDLFESYEAVKQCRIIMENNQSYRVVGIDRVKLRLQDEIVRILGQVRHVPNLKMNLISLITLDRMGISSLVEVES